MPEPLTRAALMEAAAAQLRKPDDPVWFRRSEAARALDAVLPLIADEIEAEAAQEADLLPPRWPGDRYWDGVTAGKQRAAAIIRRLIGAHDE